MCLGERYRTCALSITPLGPEPELPRNGCGCCKWLWPELETTTRILSDQHTPPASTLISPDRSERLSCCDPLGSPMVVSPVSETK